MGHGDEGIFATFYMEAVQNNFKSNAEGRPIFEEVEYVKINVKGDRLSEIVRKATDEDKIRFAEQYKYFKDGVEAPLEGTPIEEWAAISKSQCEELKFYKVRTVEDLASMSEEIAKGMGMGYLDLHKKAVLFVGSGDKNSLSEVASDLAKANVTIKEQADTLAKFNSSINNIEQLESTISSLQDKVKELENKEDKPKGKSSSK